MDYETVSARGFGASLTGLNAEGFPLRVLPPQEQP